MHRFDLRLWAVVVLASLAAACGGSSSPVTTNKTPATAFFITTLLYASGSNGSPTTPSSFSPSYYNMPSAVENVPYALAFQTNVGETNTGTHAPVTFQLKNGSLPPGLTLTPAGVLVGTPTAPGVYSFTISALDSTSPTPLASKTASYSLRVGQPGAILTQVGQNNLGGAGQNGDITVQGHLAFIGTLGAGSPLSATPSAGGESCPATGIKIVDLSQPTSPQLLTTIAGTAGTAQPQAKAAMVSSANFYANGTGDLLAIAEEPCAAASGADSGVPGGVAFYDVTNPSAPVFLGRWSADYNGNPSATWNQSGTAITVTAGVRSLAIVPANGKIYVLASVPGSELLTGGKQGDLRVIDATNPQNPTTLANWSLSQVLNVDLSSQTKIQAFLTTLDGADQRYFLDQIHTSTFTAGSQTQTYAYLSYWDEGVAILNVTDPTTLTTTGSTGSLLSNPQVLVSHIIYPTLATAAAATSTAAASPSLPEGNTHDALPVLGGKALLIADQICAVTSGTKNPSAAAVCGFTVPLTSYEGWGFLRLYDLTDPAEPVSEGFVDTPQSESDPAPDNGIYTAQNLAWNGDATHPHAYVSWFSNGLLDVDFSSLSTPDLLAAYVPPASPDPQGSDAGKNNPNAPLVYGVGAFNQSGNNYAVLSDINTGLYMVQETAPPQFAIVTSSLPQPNVGITYNAQLESVNGAGTVSYIASGSVPPGLTVNSDGSIAGTPATAGNYSFTVTASDSTGQSTQTTYSLTVASNLAIVNQSLPVATLNESYTASFAAVNGTSPYTWTVSAGSLPAGFALSSAGALSGTPTQAGTSNFSVTATDSSSPAKSVTASFSLVVEPLQFAAPYTVPNAGQDAAYPGYTLSLSNGTAPFSFALANGTSLPAGMALNSGSGGLSGTPTTAGTTTFSVTVTDADSQTATQQFTITVEPFAISTSSLPAGTVNTGYQYQLQTTSSTGAAPITYSVIAGSLPPGLNLNSSGLLTGVPTTAGNYSFTIQATDNDKTTAQQAYTLIIQSSS